MHVLFSGASRPTYAQAKVVKLGVDLDGKIEAMQRLTITQADHEAMRKEVEDLRRLIETNDEASLNLKVSMSCCVGTLFGASHRGKLRETPLTQHIRKSESRTKKSLWNDFAANACWSEILSQSGRLD